MAYVRNGQVVEGPTWLDWRRWRASFLALLALLAAFWKTMFLSRAEAAYLDGRSKKRDDFGGGGGGSGGGGAL